MKTTKRILSTLLALIMLAGLVPASVFAATERAYVVFANGTRKTYETFPAAWNAAVASSGNTVGLLVNWDGGRFCVPEDKTVNVELNGLVLTRNLSSSKGDGEVFWVGPNATLNVYGGTKENPAENSDLPHNVNVYVANNDRYGYTRRQETLYGGIINGGNSDNGGGGIHMKEGAHVNLYHVTVAGNKADKWGASYGDGGGVEMNNKYGYLYLEDSKIIYNAARYDGGGIHVDSDFCRVKMVRSHIAHNVADDNGGGIYVDGDNFSLIGDAKQIMDPESVVSAYGIPDWNGPYNYFLPDELGSSVSYNCVFDAEDGGGGIYMDNEDEKGVVMSINFIGNIATNDDDKGDGGGIYLDEEAIKVKDCNILRNKSDNYGGGIHARGDDNILDRDIIVLDSCTVWKNLAMSSSGAGGGIYVYRYVDLGISGSMIVRDNVSKSYSSDNLYLSTDGGAVDAYIVPSLSTGADVHVRISTAGAAGHGAKISRDAGSYDESMFSYDNDSGKHIKWADDRYLRVAAGSKPVKPAPSIFTPDPGKRTQTLSQQYTVNGVDYSMIKGIVSYPSFTDDNADLENVFYYSDGFFAGSTMDYNPQLATLSMCLAGAAGHSNEYGTDDSNGAYLDKSQNFRQFVSDIGCADSTIYVNDFNIQKPGSDTIGVGLASKQIFGTKTLVIIGVRGMGYGAEWISNMTLGASGEAAGWSSASTQVMAELDAYLRRMNIDGASEDTIFWIAGYSRAGATSNLTAKRIVDKYDNNGAHTFAYPIEAPMGGVESAKVAGNNYNCIHNVINQNDIVPWVGTTEMGFIRYGVDHFVPGAVETHAPSDGDDNNHIPEDNNAWDVGSDRYNNQKNRMLAQLAAVNPDIFFDDYFHTATVRYLTSQFWGTTDMIIESSDYQDEMGTTEKFIDFFFEKLQAWGFKYDINGGVLSPALSPRKYFSSYEISGHRTFQQALAFTAGLLFSKSSDELSDLLECFSSIPDRLGTWKMFCIYCNIDEDDIDNLDEDIGWIWDCLIDPNDESRAKGYRSLKDYLTKEEVDELSACFKSLLFPLLCFAGVDYDDYGQDIVGTLGYNIFRIIANHYWEVTHAWLRSYDYLYASDTVPVEMDPAVKTAPSAVAVEITHEDGTTETIVPVENTVIRIDIEDTVRLVLSNASDIDRGEAIYYRFLSGKDWQRNTFHSYPTSFRFIDMISDYSTNGLFTLGVTTAHNGVKHDEQTILIGFSDTTVLSLPSGWNGETPLFSLHPVQVGEVTALNATPPNVPGNEYSFNHWDVYYYITEFEDVGIPISKEDYIDFFGADFDMYSESTTVASLKGKSARFIPVYDRVVNSLYIGFEGNPEMVIMPLVIKWKERVSEEYGNDYYSIYWSYDPETQHYTADFGFTLPKGVKLADSPVCVYEGLEDYGLTIIAETLTVSGRKVMFSIEFTPQDQQATDEAYAGGVYVFYARDINLSTTENVKEYKTWFPGDSFVYAPVFENMEFVQWQGGIDRNYLTPSEFINNGEAHMEDEQHPFYSIIVYYRPIVNAVEITLDKAPLAGDTMPTLSSANVTITNEWRIDSAELAWSPAASEADYDKVYTARITVNKAELMGTNLSDPDAGSISLAGAFAMAESLAVTVRDADGNEIAITNYVFSETDEQIILDLVFERTAKLSIIGFADVSATVPRSSTPEQILAALPTEVYAYLADGSMISVPVEWTAVGSIDSSDLEAQTVTASGNCLDQTYMIAEGVTLTGTVTVLAVDRTATPKALPDSGSYTGLQTVSLTAEEGASIYYAIVKAAKPAVEPGADNEFIDPSTVTPPAADDYAEYTGPIIINDYDKIVMIYAYAVKGGLRDSGIVILQYNLIKPEAAFLEAKDASIAEDGNIACWYSTRLERVGFDDSENAVYEEIVDQYYADEDCTVLLDYEDVCIPAFIRQTFIVEPSDDLITACLDFEWQDTYTYRGFELIGVQAVGSAGDMRVISVLDSRIIRDAADYGFLFGTNDAELTYATASYRQSCRGTCNTLQNGDPGYQYVTARIPASFLDNGVYAGFYVTLENGVDIICTNSVVCSVTIERSEPSDNAEDNIVVDTLVVPGDVNCDGTVNATDALLAMRYAMSLLNLNNQQLANGDMNGDGIVDSTDAILIMRYTLQD